MQIKELNERILVKSIIQSGGNLVVCESDKKQLWGETVIHALGYIYWDNEKCKTIDLEISKYGVDDNGKEWWRDYLNAASIYLGACYSYN